MDGREPPRVSASQPPNMVVGPGSFGIGAMTNSMVTPNSAGMMQGLGLPFGPMTSTVQKQVDMTGSFFPGDGVPEARQSGIFNTPESEPMRKKRGRPRKYGPDGTSLALNSSSASGHSYSSASDPTAKRRGRPPGSGKKQQLDALGTPGIGFTPHVITVNVGEDIASKIMAFSQQGPRTVCILSANGAISDITIQQPSISGGTITYEGRYEIVSLTGSFLLTEDGDTRSRSGGLSVAVAGCDGRILGGVVAGMLMAATPVQVVVGSFVAEAEKPKPERWDSSTAPAQMTGYGTATAASAPSGGTSSESSGDPGSPINHSHATCSNPVQQFLSAYQSFSWPHAANQNRND
ncbi:AT-hook motif nuclear-localized protein 10-like [Canna indica]|uniref:AT-hook motif nuclear-localized protein n=1 Tax=Canna indica TaxID=4628 RepID=A0AAQ3Q545_9LILI|nr:AT-hook motif nuclear-localized protein 10-like [Canna indica]